MPRRENQSFRARTFRRSRPLILIICGSLRTEQDYLRGLRDSATNAAVDIKVAQKPRSPREVVHHAAKYVDGSARDFDEVWCVFDVDEFDVSAAVREAPRMGLRLAVSDPCFEFWLLLHHQDCSAFQDGYREVERRLKSHVARYDKTKLDFSDYSEGVPDAIRRAEKLGDAGNPSTGMWRLAMRIRNEEEQ